MLAKLMGLLFLVLGVAFLLNRKYYARSVASFVKHEGLVMVLGIFEFIVALLVILHHNIWQGWPALVTLIAWLALAESLVYLLFPKEVHKWKVKKMVTKNTWLIWSLASIVIGLYLAFQGFIA